ncbi:MAG: acyl-CoA dehydrogenase [Syntrophomonadaceae bacterium]
MAEKFISRRNIDFLLYEVFNVEKLTQYEYFQDHNRQTFNLVVDTAYKLASKKLFPVFPEMESHPPRFVDGIARVHPAVKNIMQEFGRGGWINAALPYEYGGQQIPSVIQSIIHFIFAAANSSLTVYSSLTFGAANLIVSFGSQELKDTYLENMFAGRWQGTMALTEPDAGSSLADIKTQALDTGLGYYKIKGTKIFISAGDTDAVENTVHMMLARIKGAPAGTKGISLFVVPKYRIGNNGQLVYNDLTCNGIEQKMGYKGCPICQLSMGDNNDCHGFLVGEPNKGLNYMFQMMNEKRVKVGIIAASKATACYQAALEYCNQRLQGRRIIDEKDPLSPQIPIIEHPDVKRMLLFQKAICEGSLSLCLQASLYLDLSNRGNQEYQLLADFLIPVVKSYPAEMGILSTSAAIQCLGGYGYCQDFPVEQYYRDIRIDAIHEGTTGIQAKDLLGRKVTMKNGKACQLFIEEIQATINLAQQIPELQPYANRLAAALNLFSDVTSYLLNIYRAGDAERFQADATVYLMMTGILAVGWQWLLQAITAFNALSGAVTDSDRNFYNGKLYTMQYFFNYEIPKTSALAETLKQDNAVTMEIKPKHFCD